MAKRVYYAKSILNNGTQPTIKEHLEAVSIEAGKYGAEFGCEEEAAMAGQTHDLGKYGSAFQARLKDFRMPGVDHAFASAALVYRWIMKKRYKKTYNPIIEAINAHHSGLKNIGLLTGRFAESLELNDPIEGNDDRISALSGEEYKEAHHQFLLDFPNFRPKKMIPFQYSSETSLYLAQVEEMLFTRFLFSCLVDADYSVSANEEDLTYLERTGGRALHPIELLEKLYHYRDSICAASNAQMEINQIRNDLFEQCGKAGEKPMGLFTLTAPTGTGKTLALLHFALKHCIRNGQRRIIIVLPYLTLTEQNAAVYRHIVPDLLEDHSQSQLDEKAREFAARWTAPVIITTSVRFFETLFASRPTDCRKLHQIANSVVVFDEAQSLPIDVTETTLRAVKELCRTYRTTMVFSTATQPCFDAIQDVNWHPVEIVQNYSSMYRTLRRTTVNWLIQTRMKLEDIAEEMAGEENVCTIVNLRKHARKLYHSLVSRCPEEGCFFLTTDLCPAHRSIVLEEVRFRLKEGLPCRLVATQCIEAGVDLDFAVLYRALAPLEAIIQAAGRCNRNGNAQGNGRVTVFIPEEDRLYPEEWYQIAADVVRVQAAERTIDIHNPEDIDRYYRRLFSMEKGKRKKKMTKAIEKRDYAEVDRQYRLIDDQGVRVIVPYEREETLFKKIQKRVHEEGITPELMKLAAPITVSCFDREQVEHYAERLCYPMKRGLGPRESDHYILRAQMQDCYDSKIGLDFSEDMEEPFY